MSRNNDTTMLHIAMYPWLAMGHITSFIRIGNKLAERGHKISIFLPPKTQQKFASQNHHSNLITFIPITLPLVDGLPVGCETTNDTPTEVSHLLAVAMDLTHDTIEAHLIDLKPDLVFFDFACWLPEIARKHGIKSIYYFTALLVRMAFLFYFVRAVEEGSFMEAQLTSPIPSFPSPFMKLLPHEAQALPNPKGEFRKGLTIFERFGRSLKDCDAIGVKSCKEMERKYCDYVKRNFGKPVFTAGPMCLDPQLNRLDVRFEQWLAGFESGSVVYCAFGSECILEKAQFLDLILGLELVGRPFLAALKPPKGYKTIESALPEGFEERTKEKGIVYGGWIQQQLVLQHPSVGCFVTHCGAGSLSEAMVNKCQIVLVPQAGDQFINARMMNYELKVGVEVEKRDDGFFTREAVCEAIATVMDEESQVGKEVKVNHTKWREFILKEGAEESYISSFIQELQQLLH